MIYVGMLTGAQFSLTGGTVMELCRFYISRYSYISGLILLYSYVQHTG